LRPAPGERRSSGQSKKVTEGAETFRGKSWSEINGRAPREETDKTTQKPTIMTNRRQQDRGRKRAQKSVGIKGVNTKMKVTGVGGGGHTWIKNVFGVTISREREGLRLWSHKTAGPKVLRAAAEKKNGGGDREL